MAFATRPLDAHPPPARRAESAIDARGRIDPLAAGSGARDEIGDLSRSFSAVLERLAEHHRYLESMAEPPVARAAHADRGGALVAREPEALARRSAPATSSAPNRGWRASNAYWSA
jgi:hypothetical protein